MQRLLVDSGFFFALFNERDRNHDDAKEKQEWLEILSIAMPWPILYETINTRFARRPHWIASFEGVVRSPNTEFIDDAPYRVDALEDALVRGKNQRYAMSLTDAVLHSILADPKIRVDAMLTYNRRDFFRICSSKGVELL